MTIRNQLLVLICSFFVGTTAWADLPQEFSAKYKAKYYGISVSATRGLTKLEDGSFLFSFVADSFLADLKESSRFSWSDDEHIIPQVYNYERGGLGRDRKAEVVFHWDRGQVVNNVQDKPWQMDVPTGALDKLSYQLQLRTDIVNGKSLGPYQIADGGKLKEYSFEVVGEETLTTPAGRFDVIKVRRLREQDDSRQTVIWFAKHWDYLVVRLQQEEDDKTYEIDLVSATLNGREVKGGE